MAPCAGVRLPSAGWRSRAALPASSVLHEDAVTPRRPFRRASFPSLGGTTVCVRYFAPAAADALPAGPDCLRCGQPVMPLSCPVETPGTPMFLGNPLVRLLMVLDPGGTAGARPISAPQHGPRYHYDEGSRIRDFEAQ